MRLWPFQITSTCPSDQKAMPAFVGVLAALAHDLGSGPKAASHYSLRAEASNADEAIDILTSRFDIAVVFTDVQMPGSMDGLSLAAAVRDRWPPIKIITTSGRVRVGDGDLPSGSRFLPKPYSGREVAAHLKELTGFDPGAPSA